MGLILTHVKGHDSNTLIFKMESADKTETSQSVQYFSFSFLKVLYEKSTKGQSRNERLGSGFPSREQHASI